MCQTSISVWFACKLCRGSFRQVDDFIEHKKEKHFTEFQSNSCIVFEETENDEQCPVTIKAETLPTDENIEPLIKIELNEEDPISPFNSEIIDEPNLGLVEPKSELFTFEIEINPESKNNFFGLEQPEQNPYVPLTRLTSKEIHSSCIPQLNCEKKIFANDLDEPPDPNLPDLDSTIIDHTAGRKFTEIQPAAIVVSNSVEHDLQLNCNLCSKQLESDAQLKIHAGICALYHEDRNRYCVTCNTKFSHQYSLKRHYLSRHGTEEEKLSLYKFRCHLCPKRYQLAVDLSFHLDSHKGKKPRVKTSESKPFKCLHPNCGKEFIHNFYLQRHAVTHSGLRPFSCSNCTKTFTRNCHLKAHLRGHTGERPYECTVDNCNKTFITFSHRTKHQRTAHSK